MKCPKCNEETKVLEKRNTPDADAIRRRRECLDCGHRFTTYEKSEDACLVVIKKDGTKEPFAKEKLISGVLKAIEKRPIDMIQVDNLFNEVFKELKEKAVNGEVQSTVVGDVLIQKLKKLDQVAYIRFASVYKAFKNIAGFEKELEDLKS